MTGMRCTCCGGVRLMLLGVWDMIFYFRPCLSIGNVYQAMHDYHANVFLTLPTANLENVTQGKHT